MKFEAIRRRVERSEQLVERRALRAGDRMSALRSTWRESWTPSRIVLAGLAAGFLVGHANPTRALQRLGSGGRWVQMVGVLTSLYASLQSALAAGKADAAVDHADDAASEAGQAADAAQAAAGADADADLAAGADAGDAAHAEPRPLPDRRRPDPSWNTPPAPAEAATEISER
ncbi:MAG TPA: protein sip-5 [Luteimonas sp.]|nr:protein sip-5 [Luteimonas sp.]